MKKKFRENEKHSEKELLSAIVRLVNQIDIDEFKRKLDIYPKSIMKQPGSDEYINVFNKIYLYKRQDKDNVERIK